MAPRGNRAAPAAPVDGLSGQVGRGQPEDVQPGGPESEGALLERGGGQPAHDGAGAGAPPRVQVRAHGQGAAASARGPGRVPHALRGVRRGPDGQAVVGARRLSLDGEAGGASACHQQGAGKLLLPADGELCLR
eukprot:scaffold1178_cov252-Pinguiococcus_pyrenoidosus.AAC.29